MVFMQKQRRRARPFGPPRWSFKAHRQNHRCSPRPQRISVPAVLPTLLTLANGLCGLASIAIASGALAGPRRFDAGAFAAGLIFLGMVFDVLDGQAARWLKKSSAFGAQLDSLCDAITFGAAPVFILLNFCDVIHPQVMFGVGAVYIACTLLRLARFNIESNSFDAHEFYSGLPSPAAAGTLASFAIAVPSVDGLTAPSLPDRVQRLGPVLTDSITTGLPLLALLLAWLMVSRFPYPHVVNQWVRRRHRLRNLLRLGLIVLAGLTVHELALPLGFCLFALEPPCQRLVRRRSSRAVVGSDEPMPPTAHLPPRSAHGDCD
jgi:CDP-diacylglycerol--serine O-phosphatidyltransferase